MKFRVLLALPMLLSGCAGLHKEPPMALALPGSFARMRAALATPPSRPPVDLTAYWTGFADPTLDALVQAALAQNFTIKAAKDRIDAAAASGAAENAGLLPAGTAAGEFAQSKLSPVDQHFTSPSPGRVTSAGTLDLTWALPLFGRFGATRKGAAAVLGVATAEEEEARVAVVAEIARTYIMLRADQRQLSLLRAEFAESSHIANLVSIQAAAGVASDLDLARAQNHADEIGLKLPAARLSIATDIDRIAVLEGQPTPDMSLATPAAIPAAPDTVPDLIPADLLRRRPRIMEAEAEVAADAAALGLATADLFPQLSIGGSITMFGGAGFVSPLTGGKEPDKLTVSEFGPSLTIPLLDWGQRYETAKSAQASLAAGIENYHEAVVEGVAAVDTALAGVTETRAQVEAATREQASANRALDEANTLFSRGLTDLSTLLDAEQQREKADLDATDAQESRDTALISLYEAVGGGLPGPPRPTLRLGDLFIPQ